MSSHPGADAKLKRANENIATLEHLIREFAANTYRVEMEPEFGQDPTGFDDIVIFAEAASDPPSDDWGAVIGDTVNCLRSALDHVAWDLTVARQTRLKNPPPPNPIPRRRKRSWRKVAFPVCTDRGNWDWNVENRLWGITTRKRAAIKRVQPFVTGKHAPERELLTVLDELWSIDKHRHLHLINTTVELVMPDVLTFTGSLYAELEIVSKRAAGPLVGRAEVGRARVIFYEGGGAPIPEMDVQPHLAIDVAFDQGAPAHGGRVLETLRQISEMVRAVVAAL